MSKNAYMPTNMFADGSKYGPLQSDGFDYICPECGGYGFLCDKNSNHLKCNFCHSIGTISLHDERITSEQAVQTRQ